MEADRRRAAASAMIRDAHVGSPSELLHPTQDRASPVYRAGGTMGA